MFKMSDLQSAMQEMRNHKPKRYMMPLFALTDDGPVKVGTLMSDSLDGPWVDWHGKAFRFNALSDRFGSYTWQGDE